MAIAGDQRDPELVGSIWKDDTKKNCRCTISSVRVHETVLKEKYIVYSVLWFAPNTKLMIGSYPSFHQYVRKKIVGKFFSINQLQPSNFSNYY